MPKLGSAPVTFDLDPKTLEKCDPPFWARGGHAQTLVGHFLPFPKINEQDEVVRVELEGGDCLVAHHYPGTSGTVVYLFHGLGGESHRSYMQRTALLVRRLHHTVFLVNHRGCGKGRGLAREPYHSGRSDDLSAVVREGRKRYPIATHLAIGFSLSANALLLLAANKHPLGRDLTLPDAAITVNAPINLARASELLLKGLNRIYDFNFMGDMRDAVDSRIQAGHGVAPVRLKRFSTLRDFDALYTAPEGGFRDRDHYYASASAAQYLKDIQIPTVILTAADDPFVAVDDYRNSPRSDFAQLFIAEHGGHMGYITKNKTPLGNHRWLDYALFTFMLSLKPSSM
jgi:predicted alpha/beta-fold hydrolase